MSSVFQWRGQPSQFARIPKQKSRAKVLDNAARTERVLATRHLGAYVKAVPSTPEAT